MESKYPFRRNGYIYSRGTKSGFSRMKRLGIPRPLFSIQKKLARILKKYYFSLIKKLLADIKKRALESNVTLDRSMIMDGKEEDNLEELLKFFEEKAKELADEQKRIADRANMGSVLSTLENTWFSPNGAPSRNDLQEADELREEIGDILKTEQSDYLGRLFDDADEKTQSIIKSFSIDKQKLFDDNMDELRTLYIDNSIQRIAWEQNYIKRKMLERIVNYVTGKSEILEFNDLTALAFNKGDKMAGLFARDQMQRFNKAVTLSTFINSGVTKIKWVTCHDVRVRETHRELDGKIFNINELPPEIDDYNCRCGLIPVEWAD